jgi:tRNA (guanine-N7-)-methyltransferase
LIIDGLQPEIRTFHARRGRVSVVAETEVARLWPRFGIDEQRDPLDFGILFPGKAATVLEIGFGMGSATVQLAQEEPNVGVLAVDVHVPGIASLIRACEQLDLGNVRIFAGDAVELLRGMIAVDSLAGIRAFFPDPWPKTRHNKRRLVRPDLVSLMADRLLIGGFFHAATDWADYADQMLVVLGAEPQLVNEFAGFAPRPQGRPITGYEAAGIGKGHEIFDVIFRKH